MFESHSEAIYELLRNEAGLDPSRLAELWKESRERGWPLADTLIDRGCLTRPALLATIARQLGFAYVADPPSELAAETAGLVPAAMALAYGVVPVGMSGQTLDLLATDPFNDRLASELSFALDHGVRLIVCDPARVGGLLKQYYDESDKPTALQGRLKRERSAPEAADPTAHDLATLAGQAPIVRLVNEILAQAIREHASDVHFEPFEHEFKIRQRVDGTLRDFAPTPKALALSVASRLKVLANLDIAERRVPQDGRIRTTLAGRAVDLRVSTLPTQFGESVVLRVLDQTAVPLELDKLGLPDDVLRSLRDVLHRPNGIVLVTGPTGSGKSTTLYGSLGELNTMERKLVTIEDPVEYEIEGVMQVPINPVAGLTFGAALRAFLRQDPDVIMVGEIRDLETAQIAIQASLTGHLVLSTLHTNDAPAAITRLLDMGVEPFLLASTVEAVLAQRLVRRICPHCRKVQEPTAKQLAQLGLAADDVQGRQFYYGRGCAECRQTGYRGRMGIFECLVLTDPVRELVTQNAPVQLVREQARALGMRSLRDVGLQAVFAGSTTLEEMGQHL
ncbi:MAG: GspE/PulE family protein [Opitutaceae bacterium]